MKQEVETRRSLTYDLDVNVGAVRHVLDLDAQRVDAGVGPLRGADEQDAVHLAGARPHRLVLQGGAVFEPGDDGAGLTLQVHRQEEDTRKKERDI